jgi:hypothetical protein
MLRAIGVIGVVAGLVTGVTFAALNNQAVLGASTLRTASAELKIWNGSEFAPTAPGFAITNLVPGAGSGNKAFYFQNAGGVDVNITAHVPVAPVVPEDGYGFTGWENLKVMFTNKHDGTSIPTTMAALLDGEVTLPGAALTAGAQGDSGNETAEGNYAVAFDISPIAITGDHAGVGDFNIVFTGVQVEE